MRILIEVTHPAHVHFFRNAIWEFQQRGHTVAVTAREKDVTVQLLENYKIPYTLLSKIGGSKFALIGELIIRDVRLWNFCRRFKPDILTGISAVFAAHVGSILRKPVVVWDDTEIATISHKLTYPFATAYYSPDIYPKVLGKKHKFYPGLHELAYLHPSQFKPDSKIVRELGIDPDNKYCIIRFVSWAAHHDIGQHGFDYGKMLRFVEDISRFAKPYITSEGKVPVELEKYRLNIPAHHIHHVLAFSSLYVGEGATMATESALLAVPAVYVNTLRVANINMLEQYGLVKQTDNSESAVKLCYEYLIDEHSRDKCLAAREKLLADKIDVTNYIVETLERIFEKTKSKSS